MPSIATLRDTLTERRSVREQRRVLEHELAAYTSESDRLDLDAILARHTAEDTREVRSILARQDAARTMTRSGVVHSHRAA